MVDTKKAAKSRAKRIDLSSKQPGSSGYFPPLSNGLRSGRKPLDCPRRQRFAGLIVRFRPTHRRVACSAPGAVPGWSARTRLGGRLSHRVQHSRDLKDCDLVRDPAQSMLLGTCLNVGRIQKLRCSDIADPPPRPEEAAPG